MDVLSPRGLSRNVAPARDFVIPLQTCDIHSTAYIVVFDIRFYPVSEFLVNSPHLLY